MYLLLLHEVKGICWRDLEKFLVLTYVRKVICRMDKNWWEIWNGGLSPFAREMRGRRWKRCWGGFPLGWERLEDDSSTDHWILTLLYTTVDLSITTVLLPRGLYHKIAYHSSTPNLNPNCLILTFFTLFNLIIALPCLDIVRWKQRQPRPYWW